MDFFTVENDGKDIISTNYWDSEQAQAGKFFITVNAGAFRLLVPRNQERALEDMATAKLVVVSRGAWPQQGKHDAYEVLFDDASDNPYCLHLSSEAFAGSPAATDNGRMFAFSVWVERAGQPHKVMDIMAGYRTVRKIPHMKPWKSREA